MDRILLGAVICSLFVAAHCVYSANDDVVILTPENFQKEVVNSDSIWLVEFYAPWCGHCQRLTPDWKKAATALKGVVKLGAVDCDQHKTLGGQYGIRGYPTIKVFGANKKQPEDYQGGRTTDAIVEGALNALRSLVKGRLGGGAGGSGGYDSGKQQLQQYQQQLQQYQQLQRQQQYQQLQQQQQYRQPQEQAYQGCGQQGQRRQQKRPRKQQQGQRYQQRGKQQRGRGRPSGRQRYPSRDESEEE